MAKRSGKDDHLLPQLKVPYQWKRIRLAPVGGRIEGPLVWWGFSLFFSLVLALMLGQVVWWVGLLAWLVSWAGLLTYMIRVARQHLVLNLDEVRFQSIRGTQRLSAFDVLAFVAAPAPYSNSGEEFTFVGADRTISVPVPYSHSFTVHRWVRRNWPDVVINPKEPWLDRRGTWHGLTFTPNPEEAVRAVRHAELGRWRVEVRTTQEKGELVFQAIAHTLAGPPGLWAGERHAVLRAAEDEAAHMVVTLRDSPQ